MTKLTKEEQEFLAAHEAMHAAMHQLIRRSEEAKWEALTVYAREWLTERGMSVVDAFKSYDFVRAIAIHARALGIEPIEEEDDEEEQPQ
jgi:hypothetical protein